MKFRVKHEMTGRIRVRMEQKSMSCRQADILQHYLSGQEGVTSVKVYERTGDAAICFVCGRSRIIDALKHFSYETVQLPEGALAHTGRAIHAEYREKLIDKILLRGVNKFLLPYPIRTMLTMIRSVKYLYHGARSLAGRRLDVAVLDASAIGVSLIKGNYDTAGSIMFLLGLGELLEEWTRKKSVDDLARSMSLNIRKVWQKTEDQEILVPSDQIIPGDFVVVHIGNVIPFDGEVAEGEALVNQASLTGESVPVRREPHGFVYAGTVVEEGELTIRVGKVGGDSRFEKIVAMIEESEKLKSTSESKAAHLADRLVPYTLLGTGVVWAATRNAAKALAVLMVDYSCALKLAMPVTVLSAIREAGQHGITVKGGKFMEDVSEASTIVFDKTGTLTKARPTVRDVVPFLENIDGMPETGISEEELKAELLRIAACLEEHFPHSMAKAVVDAAHQKKLEHAEMHTRVNYIVAHGISSEIDGKRVVIGSHHFVFEDEKCVIDEKYRERFDRLPLECSHLYLAIEGRLAAVILIEDPLREEAARVVRGLREAGFANIVMMTGDSERTAAAIAAKVGVDQYYAEVLPEDKAGFVEREKAAGHKVIMVGDGINDSPALSAADVGIAISDGAEIAREIADITIGADDLHTILTLKLLSNRLMRRISRNYRMIVGINTALIALGVGGLIQPTTSALLHNASTIAITLEGMKNLL